MNIIHIRDTYQITFKSPVSFKQTSMDQCENFHLVLLIVKLLYKMNKQFPNTPVHSLNFDTSLVKIRRVRGVKEMYYKDNI